MKMSSSTPPPFGSAFGADLPLFSSGIVDAGMYIDGIH